MIRSEVLPITVSAGGAADVKTGRPFDGAVHAIVIALGTWTGGAVDLTITNASDGGAVFAVTNLAGSATVYPRVKCVSEANGAITWYDKPVVNGYLRVVVADGGVSTTGTITFYVEECR